MKKLLCGLAVLAVIFAGCVSCDEPIHSTESVFALDTLDLAMQGKYTKSVNGKLLETHNTIRDSLKHKSLQLLATGDIDYRIYYILFRHHYKVTDTATAWGYGTVSYYSGGYDTSTSIKWSLRYTAPSNYQWDSIFSEFLMIDNDGLYGDTASWAQASQLDTIVLSGSDYVDWTWQITYSTGSANLTDTILYNLAYGLQTGYTWPVDTAWLIYKNADTNRIVGTYSYTWASHIVTFMYIDTIRTALAPDADTLRKVWLKDSKGDLIGVWTVNDEVDSATMAKVAIPITIGS